MAATASNLTDTATAREYAAGAWLLIPPGLQAKAAGLSGSAMAHARAMFEGDVARYCARRAAAKARAAAEANLSVLLGVLQSLPAAVRGTGINATEEDIRTLAENAAEEMRFKNRIGWNVESLAGYAAEEYGINAEKIFKGIEEEGIGYRLKDEKFWRGQLRRIFARAAERYRREAGFVSRQSGLYASDDAVKRRRRQKRRNAAMLQTMTAINELGQEFTLEELGAKSVSNPALKRAELMVRIRGFEEIARLKGHGGEFFTMTCPSRMHKMHHYGKPNEKFSGETPSEAQAYMNKVWSRIRAELKKTGIQVYGFRVAEPHHDGTPHWHGLLFMEERHRTAFRRTVAKHACREDREELGLKYFATKKEAMGEARRLKARIRAEKGKAPTLAAIAATLKTEARFWENKHFKFWRQSPARARVDFEAINWARGTAAGYIAKYIAKNIDGRDQFGQSLGADYESDALMSMTETSERVDAWASHHGIRQFQQIGGVPVTLWRELRRIAPDASDDLLMLAQHAADMGDWAHFTILLGGEAASREDCRLGLYKEEGALPNRYGETKQPHIMGVYEKETGRVGISRVHSWTLKLKNGGNAAARTCVNNCRKSEFSAKPAQFLGSQPPAETIQDIENAEVSEWLMWKRGIGVQSAVYEVSDGIGAEMRQEYEKDMTDIRTIEELAYMSDETRRKFEAAAAKTARSEEEKRQKDRETREYLSKLDAMRIGLRSALTPAAPKFDAKAVRARDEAVRRSLPARYTPPQYDTAESLLKSARRARREAAKQMARLYAAQS
ncbi:TPA: replication endonuclease [Neisseria polysaccharea]